VGIGKCAVNARLVNGATMGTNAPVVGDCGD